MRRNHCGDWHSGTPCACFKHHPAQTTSPTSIAREIALPRPSPITLPGRPPGSVFLPSMPLAAYCHVSPSPVSSVTAPDADHTHADQRPQQATIASDYYRRQPRHSRQPAFLLALSGYEVKVAYDGLGRCPGRPGVDSRLRVVRHRTAGARRIWRGHRPAPAPGDEERPAHRGHGLRLGRGPEAKRGGRFRASLRQTGRPRATP